MSDNYENEDNLEDDFIEDVDMEHDDLAHDDIGFNDEFDPLRGGSVAINGSHLAWGLQWTAGEMFMLASPDSKSKKEARKKGVEIGADLVCIPDDKEYYWGFGSSKSGMKRGMKPLAAIFAKAIPQRPFLGLFYIESAKAWYVIGLIRQTENNNPNYFNVMEETDVLLTDEAVIEDIFERHYSQHFFDNLSQADGLVIAPEDVGFRPASAEERDINEIVSDGTRIPTKLIDTSNRRFIIMSGVAIGALMIALGCSYLYHQYESHKDYLEQQAREVARQKLRNQVQERIKSQVTEKKYSYDNAPIGVYAIAECESILRHINFEAPGWDGVEATCNPQSATVTATYKKSHGETDWLETWMKNKSTFPAVPVVSFDSNGTNGTVVWSLQGMFKHRYGHHEQAGNIKNEWDYLHGVFTHYGMPVDMRISYAPKPNPIQGAPDNIKIPVFDSMSINLNSYYSPSDFIKILSPINKLLLNSLSVTLYGPTERQTGHTWKMNLSSYQLRMESPTVNKNLIR